MYIDASRRATPSRLIPVYNVVHRRTPSYTVVHRRTKVIDVQSSSPSLSLSLVRAFSSVAFRTNQTKANQKFISTGILNACVVPSSVSPTSKNRSIDRIDHFPDMPFYGVRVSRRTSR